MLSFFAAGCRCDSSGVGVGGAVAAAADDDMMMVLLLPLLLLILLLLILLPMLSSQSCCTRLALGSKMSGDLEESSAMSHVTVESARSGSWSGSIVGGFGFVDYPAGIPPKQWVSKWPTSPLLLLFVFT